MNRDDLLNKTCLLVGICDIVKLGISVNQEGSQRRNWVTECMRAIFELRILQTGISISVCFLSARKNWNETVLIVSCSP